MDNNYIQIEEKEAFLKLDTWLSQNTFSKVEEQMYQRGTFTVFIIHAVAKDKEYEGVGFAKARPDITISQYNADKGKQVSRGRAIHDLFLEYKKETGVKI